MHATGSGLSHATAAREHILPAIAGKKVFGVELRKLREAAGLTRMAVCRQANVPYSHLEAWERGVFLPTKRSSASVDALDVLLSAEGALNQLWLDASPAKESLAVMEFEIAPGIKRKQEIALTGNEEKWAAVVAEAVRNSERFTRSKEFEKGAFLKLAKPFIDSKAALAQVGAVLATEIEKIQEGISDRSLALRCRSLATTGLLAVRAFRKGTVERLTLANLSTVNGKAVLDIPPSIVKNRRPIQGPLPDVPWLHRIIAIYTKSARPLLVNRQPDEGFWFTTFGGCGRRASHNVLYNDIRQILGVNPHAMRYVLATDGKRRHLSDEEIAEVLCHTPEMTRHIYQKIDAEARLPARLLGDELQWKNICFVRRALV